MHDAERRDDAPAKPEPADEGTLSDPAPDHANHHSRLSVPAGDAAYRAPNSDANLNFVRRGITRRQALQTGGMLGLAGGLGLIGSLPATAAAATARGNQLMPRHHGIRRRAEVLDLRPSLPGERPRNIIFMVSDGMSLGVPSMAEPFSHLVRGRGTHWHELLRAPEARQGFFDTASLSGLVTDSAAASTAWASGTRVLNGALNVLPDGRPLKPIGHLAHASGRRVGLVTTTRITHATPAGFATIQASRNDEDAIAPQFLAHVDVLMGGGRKHFDARLRGDDRDLIAEYEHAGYAFVDTRKRLLGSPRPQKLLGLFHDSHMPYTIDHRTQDTLKSVPTLAEMTQVALDSLAASGDGFLLQVEGGRVDHAAHANDAAALLWDQLAFDDAIGVVRQFVAAHPDTLVIVTSDHGNANPGLNGMGAYYRDSSACFERLAAATMSYEWLHPHFASTSTVGEVHALLEQATGIDLSDDDAAVIHRAVSGDLPPELNKQHANAVGVMGQVLGNHTGVGWTGVTHTEDLMLISAFGPGAARFAGLLKNSDAYDVITGLWGIRHRNPAMSPTEAQSFQARNAQAVGSVAPHWA